MAGINDKSSYLAKGDTLVSGGQGPDEPVVGSNQIMSATRFADMQASDAEIRLNAATAVQHGGHDIARKGRVFESIKVAAGTGSSITITPALAGYDTTGKIMSGFCPKRADSGLVKGQPASSWLINTDNLSFTDIPYEDAGGSSYNVGIAVATVPSKSEINTETDKYELTQETAVIGVVAEPFSVSYNSGLNEITLVAGNSLHFGNGSSLAGRSALAWYTDDDGFAKGETTTAIQFGLLTWNGTRNQLVLTGAFGQDTASVDLTEANYRIALLGPVVWADVKDTDTDGIAWLAHGDNPTWDMDGQNRYPTTYGWLQNFVRMLDPSETAPDYVSIPKINVVPNDNEAGSSMQLQVWQDEAQSTLAFGVDKDGNIYFDGGLTSLGTPFEIGVDDANTYPVTVLRLFHTHSVGVGQQLKGPCIDFETETSPEGTREKVARVKTWNVNTSPAPGAVDGSLSLAISRAGTMVDPLLCAEDGKVYVSSTGASDIVGASLFYDPSTDPPLNASMFVVGDDAQASMAGFSTVYSTAHDSRGVNFKAFATGPSISFYEQGNLRWSHYGTSADKVSYATLNVFNDLSLVQEPVFYAYRFADFAHMTKQMGLQIKQLRPFDDTIGIRVSTTADALAGEYRPMSFVLNSNDSRANMITNDAEYRIHFGYDTTDVFDYTAAFIGYKPETSTENIRFGQNTATSTRFLLNLQFGSTANTQARIQQYNGSTPLAFSTQGLSPLQVIHDEAVSSTHAGIDICNYTASNTKGGRSTCLNFLGRTGGGVETRPGGLRFNFDDDVGSGNDRGRASLFVNDGSSSNNVGKAIQLYPDGSVLADTIPVWAYVVDGTTTPVYSDQVGFNTVTSIGHAATGQYTLTTLHTHSGGTLGKQVQVTCGQPGYTGYGVWTSTTTMTIYIWDADSPFAAADILDFYICAWMRVTPKA